MKVCIIGKNSYIGNHIDQWLSDSGYEVYQFDVLNEGWETFDYSCFDVVIHVAGIVHRPDCSDVDLYKRVNTDLPIAIAKKFKSTSRKQVKFIFLSTMAVYGMSKRLQKNMITIDTPTSPLGLYGKSKREAEIELLKLQDKYFNVIIVRPPNVYGKGCKGGYIPGFVKVVKKLPAIPDAYTNVKQSMLYIDNLCELIRLLIKHDRIGIYMPQDEKPVSAVDISTAIARGLGKNIRKSKLLGCFVQIFKFLTIIKKAYGGVEYDVKLSKITDLNYCVIPFEEAMIRTIK